MCLAAVSSYPCTYTGTRLGVTATVVRLDDAHANLTLRAGPLPIARGEAFMTSNGELVLDKKITRTLRARGVSIVDVTPPSQSEYDCRSILGGCTARPFLKAAAH